jgi:sporulation related protein
MRLNYRFSLFTLLLFFASLTVGAQEALPQYTVRIGSFANPKPADFAALRGLGFVYAKERPSTHTNVFIGGYTSKTDAGGMVEILKSKGHGNSNVSDLNVKGGNATNMIQLATRTVGENIDWEKFMQVGRVYVLLEDKSIKILTGVFPDSKTAKEQLSRIREMGFAKAFPKTVNNALLHEVGEFETGDASKKPLIPLDFSDKTPAAKKEVKAPASYDDAPLPVPAKSGRDLTAKGVPAAKIRDNGAANEAPPPSVALPDIRPNVKRTSALELQKILKAEGTYKGSLDGYYGTGTKASYAIAAGSNRQLQKYRVLAKHFSNPANEAPQGSLQYYINTLWENPKTALDAFESSSAPIAKAYRAYFLFVNDGASASVNQLMNEAIIEAFAGNKAAFAKFDPAATYAYFDLDQLLLHIRYLHEVSPGNPAVPCWMFRKHSGVALQAFGPQSGRDASNLRVGNCGGFWEWEEVELLHAICRDICSAAESDEAKDHESQSALASLFLTPKAPGSQESKALEAWNTSLWKGIDVWSSRDPMLQEMNTALKLAYFQTWVLLEDFYMNEGFTAKDSKALSLQALKALVGHHLSRFI